MDTDVFDRHFSKLVTIKNNIDSLEWLEELPGKKFTLENVYHKFKKQQAGIPEKENSHFVLPGERKRIKTELLEDRKILYRVLFRMLKDRLNDRQAREKYLILMRDLAISDSLLSYSLVAGMRSEYMEKQISAFRFLYEEDKNNLIEDVMKGEKESTKKKLTKTLAEGFDELSREIYEEIGKIRITVIKGKENRYRLVPAGFLSLFRGRAGIFDCSFKCEQGGENPLVRAIHEDNSYYLVYKGKELKGYVGLCFGKNEKGERILTVDTIQSPSLDGEELLMNLFKALGVVAEEKGCIGIALPGNLRPDAIVSFNFDNKRTIMDMDIYKNAPSVYVEPINKKTWDSFYPEYAEDKHDSMFFGKFRLITLEMLGLADGSRKRCERKIDLEDGIYNAGEMISDKRISLNKLCVELTKIEIEAFRPGKRRSERYIKLLAGTFVGNIERDIALVAVKDGEIVGFILAGKNDGGLDQIKGFAVRRGDRSRGIGTGLLDNAVEAFLGHRESCSFTLRPWPDAESFYTEKYFPSRVKGKSTKSWWLGAEADPTENNTLKVTVYKKEEIEPGSLDEQLEKTKDGVYDVESIVKENENILREVVGRLCVIAARGIGSEKVKAEILRNVNNKGVLMTVRENAIVGFIEFGFNPAEQMTITNIFVDQEELFNEVGSELMDEFVEEILEKENINDFRIIADPDTRTFYSKYINKWKQEKSKITAIKIRFKLYKRGCVKINVNIEERIEEASWGERRKRKAKKRIKEVCRETLKAERERKETINSEEGTKINIITDVSLLTEEDLEDSITEWAYLILKYKEHKNVNFIFKQLYLDYGEKNIMSDALIRDIVNAVKPNEFVAGLQARLAALNEVYTLGLDIEKLFTERIGDSLFLPKKRLSPKKSPEKSPVEILISSSEMFKWIEAKEKQLKKELIKDNQYPVAMEGSTVRGQNLAALWDFQGAMDMAMVKAELVIAKENGNLEETAERLSEQVKKLYEIMDKKIEDIDEKTLQYMINEHSKLEMAIEMALPAIGRMSYKERQILHGFTQDVLRNV